MFKLTAILFRTSIVFKATITAAKCSSRDCYLYGSHFTALCVLATPWSSVPISDFVFCSYMQHLLPMACLNSRQMLRLALKDWQIRLQPVWCWADSDSCGKAVVPNWFCFGATKKKATANVQRMFESHHLLIVTICKYNSNNNNNTETTRHCLL